MKKNTNTPARDTNSTLSGVIGLAVLIIAGLFTGCSTPNAPHGGGISTAPTPTTSTGVITTTSGGVAPGSMVGWPAGLPAPTGTLLSHVSMPKGGDRYYDFKVVTVKRGIFGQNLRHAVLEIEMRRGQNGYFPVYEYDYEYYEAKGGGGHWVARSRATYGWLNVPIARNGWGQVQFQRQWGIVDRETL